MDIISTDIIERCKSGDKDAFRILVKAYHRMLFSLSLKMLCNEEDAKDAVQESFIKIWQSIDMFRNGNNFTTWVYTIATRLCIDRLRVKKRYLAESDDEVLFGNFVADDNPEAEIENRQWVAIVRTLCGSLPEKQRLAFTLCRLEGLSPSDVEQITGMTVEQIKSNLYIAHKSIREKLKKLGYE